MGLSVAVISFLLDQHRRGVDFSSVCTLGRQEINATREETRRSVSESHLAEETDHVLKSFDDSPAYADRFFQSLGCTNPRAFDNSTFEGASDVHDFNTELPADCNEKFSVVFDGGTLEHLFNFPTAIANCMRLVARGGHFLGLAYTNNLSGHGFYQFSPELMYRIFDKANGFEDTEVFVVETERPAIRYRVKDPADVGHRIQITNTSPTFLFVSSRKTREVTPFLAWPQQSDYSTRWTKHQEGQDSASASHHVKTGPLPGSVLANKLLPLAISDALRALRASRIRRARLRQPFPESSFEKKRPL